MASLQRFMGLGKHPAYDGAIAYFDAEQYSDAIPLFEMAIQECNDPTVQKLARAYLAESYAKVGYKRMNQGDWSSAYNYFTMATDYAPQYADWWFQAGFAAYQQGDYTSALNALQQATQVNPTFARAWFCLGLAQYASGQQETGVALMQQWSVQLGLANDEFLSALQLHQAGRFADAQQAFEKLLSFGEDNYAEYIRRGDEAYQRGDLSAAEACFRHVLNARPNYADVRNRLGVVLTGLGRDEEAVEQFIAALRINPRYVEAHINLAITYYELGFTDQAKAHYHQVLTIDPENRVAREALQQLAA
ncbi:MAG: tetratricopeptide repeat protein [Fimbriimonadales bacterium]|nr:tetratricopeptide repeat protein [Fimbriimonadales bacterium]